MCVPAGERGAWPTRDAPGLSRPSSLSPPSPAPWWEQHFEKLTFLLQNELLWAFCLLYADVGWDACGGFVSGLVFAETEREGGEG